MRRWLALAFTLSLGGILFLFGPYASAQSGLPAEALDKEWPLTSLQATVGKTTNTTGKGIALSFAADGTFSGSDGCNRYLGTYTASADGSIELTLGPTTMIACGDDMNALAEAYKAALGAVKAFALTDTGLELTGVGVVLAFKLAEAPDPAPAAPPDNLPTTGGAEDLAGLLMIGAATMICAGVGLRQLASVV